MKTLPFRKVLIASTLLTLGFSGLVSCTKEEENPNLPKITSLTPVSGSKGTVVTVAGTNFSSEIAQNVVTINGKIATVTNATATQLTVTIPAAAGTGPILVTSKGQAASNQPSFTYHWQVSTFAGNDTYGFAEGTGTDAQFKHLSGVTFDAMGTLYVADMDNNRIRKITPDGTVSTLAGSSSQGYADGSGTAALFYAPRGIAADKQGNLYVSDYFNYRIRKITPEGVVSTLAGNGKSGFADGQSTTAQFNRPRGLAVDAQGNVYVADEDNRRIRKITPNGTVSTLAGSGTSAYADGNGTAAAFIQPTGIAIDAQGNLYVADYSRIRKITSSGQVSTLAGNGAEGYVDGGGASAQFDLLQGIAIDEFGNLYVTDAANQRIRKITPAGVVSTLAGSGTEGFADGTGTTAQFKYPEGIAVDTEGKLYVGDYFNKRVRKIE